MVVLWQAGLEGQAEVGHRGGPDGGGRLHLKGETRRTSVQKESERRRYRRKSSAVNQLALQWISRLKTGSRSTDGGAV